MPTSVVLRTATVNASIALCDPGSFGAVEVGKRADLLLLDRDPLLTARNLRDPRGVMVRGIWLDHSKLKSIRRELRAIYHRAGADGSLDHPSSRQVNDLLAGMAALARDSWTFNDHQLGELAGMLRDEKRDSDATRVENWIAATR